VPRSSDEAPPDSAAPNRRQVLAALGAAATLALARPAAATQAGLATGAAADGVATVLVEAKTGVTEFEPGKATDVLTFGSRVPGPVLRVRKGEEFRAKLVNSLDQPLTLHWHGVRIVNAMDGVAFLTQPQPVAPGMTAEIRFVPPDAGTFLYRPMVLGRAGELTDRGLAGLFVVEEPSPPAADGDIALVIDDWRLNGDMQAEPFGGVPDAAGLGRLGNRLTVSGATAPRRETVAPGARLRLRIASVANARLMKIRFDGLRAWVIAVNGQPTDSFEPLRATLPLLPGTRYDLLAEMPAEPGQDATLTGLLGPSSAMPLAVFRTGGDPAGSRRGKLPPVAPLGDNPLLPAAIPLQKAVRVDLAIQGGGRPGPDGGVLYAGDPARIWTVNGISGDVRATKALFSVKRGSAVVLALANKTAFPQVMHIHGHVVRYLHPFDDGWEPYWLDTLLVPEGQTLRVAFIADNPGRWLIGAGVLERLDTGLSAWFEVT
jgi:FtsP/CotA-like multicopper oxidase with cupredoxin domain